MAEKPITYPEELHPTAGEPSVDPMDKYPVGPTRTLPGSKASMALPGAGGNVKAMHVDGDAKKFAENMSTLVPGAGDCAPISRPSSGGTNPRGVN